MLRQLIRHGLPLIPKPLIGRVARRYVAGADLEAALGKVGELNRGGLAGTLALLGEEVTHREHAETAVDEYLRTFRELHERGLDSGVSIKLTLLGLRIDESFCRANLERVAAAARDAGIFVRIDMEDHTCTDATLRLYREARGRYDKLGIVLQAYLRRTLGDISALEPGTSVRLCKGIYPEPRAVAFLDYDTVRANFLAALEQLIRCGAKVAVATHDEYLVAGALAILRRLGVDSGRCEFQTLLGVDEPLRDLLRQEGHRVRVYIPYGADWYAYSIRRLRENPQIALHVMRAMVGRRR